MNTRVWLAALLGSLAGLTLGSSKLSGQSGGLVGFETPVPSRGSEAGVLLSGDGTAYGPQTSLQGTFRGPMAPAPLTATIGASFPGPGFDDNETENGAFSIPPDPIGAAGTDRVIAVVNRMIEARSKTGILLYRDSLRDFFSSLSLFSGSSDFDPKVIYDHYEDRFLVVAIELIEVSSSPNPGNISRLLLAVSKTGTPATATTADWWFHAIDSKTSIGGQDHWADYPGFEVDEEAVYITANMFRHILRSFGGIRLWIVDKGAVGGFYDGGTATVTVHDPYAGGGDMVTTMPAEVFGPGGVGPGIGTFLVSYSALSAGGVGGTEFVQVVRIDNPLGVAPSFTREIVPIGDIENVGGIFGFPALPDAPQSGTGTRIEVNDRRTLDAVWRDGSLWLTTTIEPNSGPSFGETTAHWVRLDTSAVTDSSAGPSLITLGNQGDIHGDDIVGGSNGVFTFFPAVAVNGAGDAMFGFSASASTIFAGAYVVGRRSSDPPGTVRDSQTVQAGRDFYVRTFGGSENRWGDYSGIALDPMDDNVFWVFNEFADLRGTPTGPPFEDGRWGTAWARATYKGVQSDFNADSRSDILWRNTANWSTLIWQMNGFVKQATGSPGGAPSVWKVTGLGDFNGGGQADILWRNTSGSTVIWQMNGFQRVSSVGIGAPPLDWKIFGVGDFDGDGTDDILWRNTNTDSTVIWRIVGLGRDSVASFGSPDTFWQIQGVGDFDGDGTEDILWRSTSTNAILIWRILDLAKVASVGLGTVDAAWQVVGVGDFDGDGTDDILWRNTNTDSTVIWRIVGLGKVSSGGIGAPDTTWQVACVGDYDGGGKSDILWRNTSTNSTVIWQMNGFVKQATGSIGAPSSVWQIRC